MFKRSESAALIVESGLDTRSGFQPHSQFCLVDLGFTGSRRPIIASEGTWYVDLEIGIHWTCGGALTSSLNFVYALD